MGHAVSRAQEAPENLAQPLARRTELLPAQQAGLRGARVPARVSACVSTHGSGLDFQACTPSMGCWDTVMEAALVCHLELEWPGAWMWSGGGGRDHAASLTQGPRPLPAGLGCRGLPPQALPVPPRGSPAPASPGLLLLSKGGPASACTARVRALPDPGPDPPDLAPSPSCPDHCQPRHSADRVTGVAAALTALSCPHHHTSHGPPRRAGLVCAPPLLHDRTEACTRPGLCGCDGLPALLSGHQAGPGLPALQAAPCTPP